MASGSLDSGSKWEVKRGVVLRCGREFSNERMATVEGGDGPCNRIIDDGSACKRLSVECCLVSGTDSGVVQRGWGALE